MKTVETVSRSLQIFYPRLKPWAGDEMKTVETVSRGLHIFYSRLKPWAGYEMKTVETVRKVGKMFPVVKISIK